MEYRKIGDSDLYVSVITFGAWAAGGWMWGSTDRKQAVEAIRSGIDVGMTSIDTAPIYGQGTSEEIVREVTKDIPRDKIQILTKFGLRWDVDRGEFVGDSKNNEGQPIVLYRLADKESIVHECEQSLKRLGTDYIDLYQIHWPDSTTPIEESFEAVYQLVKDGKIRYAGVCNYSVEQMQLAEEVCPIISNQVPFSMVNREIEEKVLPYCLVNNKAILAYSPMQRGLLTGKMKENQAFAEGDHRTGNKFFTNEMIKKANSFLEEIRPIAEEHNATVGQLVLRWTIDRPGITVALAGARDAEQTLSNAKAAGIKLSEEEFQLISNKIEVLL